MPIDLIRQLNTRISGISTEIGKILENAAQRMCKVNKTTPQDISTDKEVINLLKMSLTTVFNTNKKSSISEVNASNVLDQVLRGISLYGLFVANCSISKWALSIYFFYSAELEYIYGSIKVYVWQESDFCNGGSI